MDIYDYGFILLAVVLPSGMVLASAYLTMKLQHRKQLLENRKELQLKAASTVMPLRISAYERAVLFCERITIESLVSRAEAREQSAEQLKAAMIDEIRAEYTHNAVQQLYISDGAWQSLTQARDKTIGLLAKAADQLPKTASGPMLLEQLLKEYQAAEEAPAKDAIQLLKRDMARGFV